MSHWVEPPIPLNSLPREPGIYRMLDGERKVLYVGKARNLRKRVSSYFQRRPDSPRTQAMVQQIRDIAFHITPSEADALILEHHLIKQLKPRYNVLLKDSKSYPYILLTDESFPKLKLYRGDRSLPGEYFGPFPNAGAVHTTLHEMQSIFRIRDCEDASFQNRSRPCMQHQINRCSAPCCGLVSQEEYRQQIESLRAFFQGKNEQIIRDWEQQMQAAAAAQAFEQAAQLRDRIHALRTILAGSEKRHLPDHADAIVLLRHTTGVMALIGVRRNSHDFGSHPLRINQATDADDLEILQALLLEHYRREPPPQQILLLTDQRTADELSRLLKLLHHQSRCEIVIPKQGARLQWLEQLQHTGRQMLASHQAENQQPAFEALAALLQLDTTPERIAAVDNAHLGGKQMVAAITYANWQGAEKANYRRYRLDAAENPATPLIEGDDYGAMAQVLRRFFRAIAEQTIPQPDLMLIDGGRGQLRVALDTLAETSLTLKLVAVAKGEGRKVGNETLWPGWRMHDGVEQPNTIGEPIQPGVHSPALLLIARVRDEAHRFAGAYMRKRKKQSMFTSSLDTIHGIGPNKRAALLKHFGGIDGVKKASRDQLTQVAGISGKLAEQIFTALHR